MGGQVEDPGKQAAGAQPHKHETQLADGRVGPHLLDVTGHHGHGRGHQHADRSDGQADAHGRRRQGEKTEQAGEQVDAGGHHGGRMQQGAHRRGALHGVGQPGEQRKLGAFAGDAPEDQQARQGDHAGRQLPAHRGRIGKYGNVQGAQLQPEQHDAQQKGHIAGTGHHEGLFTGFAGAELVEPEPDQQVGGQSHQLPEDVELQQRTGDGQGQHGPGEQGHAAVVAPEAGIAGHVAQRVDLHQQADHGHHNEHQEAGRIQQDADGNGHLTRGEPGSLKDQRFGHVPVLDQ